MKEENATIIAIISLTLMLSFFAYLVYLLKKEEPITVAQPAQTVQTPETIYSPAPQEKVVVTEEIRPTVPHIINQILPVANRIYEIKIPRFDVRTWSLRCRNDINLQYSFEPSFSTYMTLPSGQPLNEFTSPNRSIYAVYVRSPTANVVAELELWRE